MCLLVSNTPGFDNISHMTALIVDLGIVTHRRYSEYVCNLEVDWLDWLRSECMLYGGFYIH